MDHIDPPGYIRGRQDPKVVCEQVYTATVCTFPNSLVPLRYISLSAGDLVLSRWVYVVGT